LFVIARNSSFTYKGRAIDVRTVGQELGVRYVLEGSVRRGGNRLRFTGQLIDAVTGAHIWADRFDGDLSDVFALQDRITENVVAAIEPKLQLAEIERLKHKTVADLNAYDHLLRAQQLEYEFTEQSLDKALGHLRQALGIDPVYAPAMALAAYCYGEIRFQGWSKDVEGETAQGLQYMSRALELARFDPNVLWMCALASWQLGFDTKRAQELAYRSLETNPNSAIAMTIAGWIEAYSETTRRAANCSRARSGSIHATRARGSRPPVAPSRALVRDTSRRAPNGRARHWRRTRAIPLRCACSPRISRTSAGRTVLRRRLPRCCASSPILRCASCAHD